MAALSKQQGYTLKDVNQPCHVLHPSTTCMSHAFSLLLHGVAGSSKFYLLIYLIPLLIRRSFSTELLLQEVFNLAKSISYAACCSAIAASSICIFRRLLGRFYIVTVGLIPGAVGGASIFLESSSKRGPNSTLYLAVVTNLYLKMFQEKGLINISPLASLLMFSVCSSGLLYCLRSIPNSYSMMWPIVPQKVPSNPEAQKHCRHKGRCLDSIQKAGIDYFFYGLGIQGTKVIAYNFKLLLTKPSLFLQALLNRNNVVFPIFLGLYSSLFKGVSCLLVNLRGRDEAWQALIAGGVASLSYLIQPNLTLTCLAFSNLSQILCRAYRKKLKVPPWPWVEISCIILMGMIVHVRAAYPDTFPRNMASIMDAVTSGRSNVVYGLVEEHLVRRL